MSASTIPALARWDRLRYALCWRSRVLAPALAALTPIVTTRVPTAAVDRRGRLFLNPGWAQDLSDGEVNFVILHECLHMVLRHWERRGARDHALFNVAADLVINEAIAGLGVPGVTMPADGLDRVRVAPWIPAGHTTEEVYDLLRDRGERLVGDATHVGAGCGVDDAGDADVDDTGLSPGEWKNIAQTVAQLARHGGRSGGPALAALLTIPPARVAWRALLRELAASATSRAGRDVTTWARRSRRSPRRVVLPGRRTNDVRLAVIIDSSGSMSDAELAACVAETHAAVVAAGVRAYLVVHDHEVRVRAWITPHTKTADIGARVIGRGGTIFTPAYGAVAALPEKFAAVVHFTDGFPCDPWPPRPHNCARAVCALTTQDRTVAPAGWRIVPIRVPGRV